MRINGILLPSDWNDDGQVTDLILATSDEAEFRIETDRSLQQLERYIRRKVVIDGELATSGLLKLNAIGFYDVDLKSDDDNFHPSDRLRAPNQQNRETQQ